MKKILVPTDFSDHAEYALKVAAQIARKNNGEIVLLHMLELPHEGSDAIGSGHDIPEIIFFKKKAEERLDEIANSDILSGINVTQITKLERAFDGILNFSGKDEIDLIVMGSHGASGFREMFIGSNTEKVVRHSETPVLVIKKDSDNFTVNNFVFASDFTDEAKKPFKKVIEFANEFNAKIHLLMVNTPQDFTASFDISNYATHIYNDVNVEKGILHFAKSVNADLIGISTHGRKGLSHFFNGSISEDLINHAKRPVVTFKI